MMTDRQLSTITQTDPPVSDRERAFAVVVYRALTMITRFLQKTYNL